MSGAPNPVYVDPQTDGKAIGSLVCGVIGLLCVPCSVVAVILGHQSLSSIKRAQGRLGGDGLAIGGLVTGYLGLVWGSIFTLAVFAGMTLPVLAKAREKARRVNCANNLKQIGLGLLMYSGKNNGNFPLTPPGTNFEPLNQGQLVSDGKVYGCPSAPQLLETAANASYVYVGSGLRDDVPNAPGVVLAYDRSGNHPDNQWMNALFADGHVEGARPDGSKGWNTYRADRPH